MFRTSSVSSLSLLNIAILSRNVLVIWDVIFFYNNLTLFCVSLNVILLKLYVQVKKNTNHGLVLFILYFLGSL